MQNIFFSLNVSLFIVILSSKIFLNDKFIFKKTWMFWFENVKISSKSDLFLLLKLFYRFTDLENWYYVSENVGVNLVFA